MCADEMIIIITACYVIDTQESHVSSMVSNADEGAGGGRAEAIPGTLVELNVYLHGCRIWQCVL